MTYETNYPIQIAVVVDAAKTALSTTAIDVMDIPQGFVCTGVVYEEIADMGSSIGLTLAAKTASATLAQFSTGASTALACGYAGILGASATTTLTGTDTTATATTTLSGVGGVFFTKAGDTLTLASASTIEGGRIRIGLVGFLSGVKAVITDACANSEGLVNVAEADPYVQPEDRH